MARAGLTRRASRSAPAGRRMDRTEDLPPIRARRPETKAASCAHRRQALAPLSTESRPGGQPCAREARWQPQIAHKYPEYLKNDRGQEPGHHHRSAFAFAASEAACGAFGDCEG